MPSLAHSKEIDPIMTPIRRVDRDRSQRRPDGRNFLRPDASLNLAAPAEPARAFKIRNPKRIGKGALIGSFDLELSLGLKVTGAMLVHMNGVHWITLPATVEFVSSAARERFKTAVLTIAEAALR
jgi:hypothetical protein